MKDDELIIRFLKDNHELVEVIDEGKTIPSEEFPRYESMLDNYLRFRSLEDIVPRVSRLKREIRRHTDRLDIVRIRDLVRLRLRLDSLGRRTTKSRERIARRLAETILETKQDLIDVQTQVQLQQAVILRLEEQIADFMDELYNQGIISKKKDVTITIKKGQCWVDGKKLSREKTEEFEEIWNKHMDEPFDKTEKRTIKQ
jgi:hypothetical protein